MTAWELFSNVMTLMFGTDSEMDEYQDYFVNTLNLILAELFDTNNALRMSDGRKPLKNIPEVPKLDTTSAEAANKTKLFELPYEPKLLRTVLPYGVAGYIYVDDDKSIGADYKNKYEYAKSQILNVSYEDIIDVYSECGVNEKILADDKWSLAEEVDNG